MRSIENAFSVTATEIPRVDRPDVSVLLVTHGALDWVRRCVAALVEQTPPRYEVVVVDNASADGTAEWLREQVRGARLIEPGRNLGFGTANNLAAAHARGRFLCLLNSDVLVTPGWMDGLTSAFARSPRVGAAVPLYLNEDGTVQEAGCAVEPTGRVVALGAGDSPDAPDYRFARAVQYGSAACLTIRRSTFQRLGGFDAAYGPAYYEDVDLAFRLRERGLRVWLEPSVRVVHGRAASSPTHDEAVVRREANRERFRSRWAHRLAGRPVLVDLEHEPHRLFAARDLEAPRRVLVVCDGRDPSRVARAGGVAVEECRRDPDARVTLALPETPDPPAGAAGWWAAGVEVAAGEPRPGWLAARLFHYSSVLAPPGLLASLAPELDECQPQAERTALDLDRPPAG